MHEAIFSVTEEDLTSYMSSTLAGKLNPRKAMEVGGGGAMVHAVPFHSRAIHKGR